MIFGYYNDMFDFTKFISFLIFFLGLFLASCSPNLDQQKEEEIDYLTGASQMSFTSSLSNKTHKTKIEDAEKVRLAIQRQKQISTIRKGDYMIVKNQPKEALGYYLAALQKIPDDIVLIRKIAHSYFLLKNWEQSYEYFIRVPTSELSDSMQDELFKSLFYNTKLKNKKQELNKFETSLPKKSLYYTVLLPCFSGISACQKSIKSYKGDNKKLNALKSILQDANYVSPTNSYRQLRIAVGLYEQEMYGLAYTLASSLIKQNPDYIEAKKIQGFSHYELGRYEEAKKILLSYLENNAEDLEVIIRLGEICTYLEDYENAILYLNNAIIAGYKPKTLLERRLAYNYAKLDDIASMEKVVSYLLQEEDATEDDYSVAISLAINKKQYNRAYAWSYEGLKRFSESKILVPLYLQATRLSKRSDDAQKYLDTLSKEIRALPLVRLEEAILLYEKKESEEAKKIFSSLVDFDGTSDF